jgi:LacI family transcriptional regulator
MGTHGSRHAGRWRVGLFMGLTDHYEHGIARGVIRYARGRPDWDLYGFGWMFQPIGSLERWDGDGLMARIESGKDADRLALRGLPLVDVAGAWHRQGFRHVCNDDAATGTLAGRHLRALGVRSFAFCGVSSVGWSRARREGFRAAVSARGLHSLRLFEESLPWWKRVHHSERLLSWLRALPKPVALFACNDTAGLKVAAACRAAGLRVPQEVAILGVDNEDILCELSVPPLSSIMLDCERIGYQAAELLAEMLDGGEKPERAGFRRAAPRPERGLIAPREVVERASTRLLASDDPLVAQALGIIHGSSAGRLSVTGVLKGVPASRRSLEIRFRAALGRSIHDEIVRMHVEKARELLREGTLTMAAVAVESGFTNAQRFHESFKRIMGTTPGAYRRSYRG